MTLNELDPLATHVAQFPKKRVLVLGDAMLDEYLHGDCSRISPEAPVPVLRVASTRVVLGGAANTAANIVSLGGHATLIALVGSDEGGQTLKRCASDAGLDLLPVDHGLRTLRKTRVVGQQQQIVRLDYEEIRPNSKDIEAQVMQLVDACVDDCDIVVISDYAKGFLSVTKAQAIIGQAHESGLDVIVDPRPQHRDCYHGCDYLTPNWKESRALLRLGDPQPCPAEIDSVARSLGFEVRANVVVTLGCHGHSFCSRDGVPVDIATLWRASVRA